MHPFRPGSGSEEGHILAVKPMNEAPFSELSATLPVYRGVGGICWLNRCWHGAPGYGH